ncbi:hypothetical protein A5906_05955 [Bradyrhizobium sacchari]|uniref:TonB-like protein n=1 Tax=Bradyrhizobium sacchari TaxID=1399419 RepID=A0A560KK41_9BRAD|nr:hypothetical protein [Bradyrhizobium sacchari]OPY95541.1 hypothetical protein A5906_05955 [Bradyrhizobium sacchari]TWB66350.1 hypothetical protein FBZ94_10121 [Bradyrhizobium sacchari]TWB83587.1 hypothetical protein FBZ95_10121 [Bradyrhizobium sacchari]
MARCSRLPLVAVVLLLGVSGAVAEEAKVNTIQDVFRHLRTCWKPPPPAKARPLDITVVVSFNRSGDILGHPRITYESAEASDNDRLQYRIAVMEALQRCTPMPFTDAMAGAAAGRPFAIQFRNRKTSPPTQERRA